MSASLKQLSASLADEAKLSELRAAQLDARLSPPADSILTLFSGMRGGDADRLRVAAVASTAALLSDRTLESLFSPRAAEEPEAEASTRQWQAALISAQEAKEPVALDDLVLFAATALLARQSVSLRRALKEHPTLQDAGATSDAAPWVGQVRARVSQALLLVVRQDNHAELQAAAAAIAELAELQRAHDAAWAPEAGQRDLFAALGLYHLAHAVGRVSEFLVSGSVLSGGRAVRDVAAELRRLLVKAEEYITLCGDAELRLWLTAVSVILWRLRADSIWVGTQGISDRVDQLVRALSGAARERPIFTLLPSQHEALRSRLLDPAQIAVVLQMPTSTGKTLLAELAIAQVFGAYREGARVAYICPTRALAAQVRRTLAEDLGPLGVRVSAAGAAFEEDPYELALVTQEDGVVVTTPEKLDLLVRVHPDWAAGLRLIVVDEAHLLGDGERGARLELLLANLRREQPDARLLLLTPFVQNARAIAEWLGDERGAPIEVHWRPSRLLLGAASIEGRGKQRAVCVEWREPHGPGPVQRALRLATDGTPIGTATERVTFLRRRLTPLGVVLGMFSGSRSIAEDAAREAAQEAREIPLTPALRVALAAVEHDYGVDSTLAYCLRRGVAFHHSALSPLVRGLIEDQLREGVLRYVAATTTLAQGMNFPVATVIIHSVKRPWGGGALSAAELWNIAGRAGRVGLAEEGLVVFATDEATKDRDHYTALLNEEVVSALLTAAKEADRADLKAAYRDHPALRPFLQYLNHAVSTQGARRAWAQQEELVQSSLAARQSTDAEGMSALRQLAREYLELLFEKKPGMLTAADHAGLGHFSFDELFAKVGDNPLLSAGPSALMGAGVLGLTQLVGALCWLPEMRLGLDRGPGAPDPAAVARVAQGWMSGEPVVRLAHEFKGDTSEVKTRKAGTYVYGTLSGVLSWGAHAYTQSWMMHNDQPLSPEALMLPAYLQHGVGSPEAAVAALLGVPRALAEPFAARWRADHGPLTPAQAPALRAEVERADVSLWAEVLARSPWSGRVDPAELHSVLRRLSL